VCERERERIKLERERERERATDTPKERDRETERGRREGEEIEGGRGSTKLSCALSFLLVTDNLTGETRVYEFSDLQPSAMYEVKVSWPATVCFCLCVCVYVCLNML
jgi:hypothetical protein